MEYVYAAMLLHKAKQKINEAGIKKVLEAAGVKVDDTRVKALIAALDGVDIEKAIEKSAAVPVAAAPAPAGEAKEAAPKKAEKKEKKVSEEEAAAGLGALFG